MKLADCIRRTLKARIIPHLPLDDTRDEVKEIIDRFEFEEYLRETENNIISMCCDECAFRIRSELEKVKP